MAQIGIHIDQNYGENKHP